MNNFNPDEQTLKRAMDFVGTESALSRYLHNGGYNLRCNTVESDEMWLARNIFNASKAMRSMEEIARAKRDKAKAHR